MAANANSVSQVLQAHTSSLSNKNTLVQHIKSAVNIQQSSLKKILERFKKKPRRSLACFTKLKIVYEI